MRKLNGKNKKVLGIAAIIAILLLVSGNLASITGSVPPFPLNASAIPQSCPYAAGVYVGGGTVANSTTYLYSGQWLPATTSSCQTSGASSLNANFAVPTTYNTSDIAIAVAYNKNQQAGYQNYLSQNPSTTQAQAFDAVIAEYSALDNYITQQNPNTLNAPAPTTTTTSGCTGAPCTTTIPSNISGPYTIITTTTIVYATLPPVGSTTNYTNLAIFVVVIILIVVGIYYFSEKKR